MSLSARIARSFGRSFESYDQAATPQLRIAENLAERLSRAGAPTRFAKGFEFGCGTGALTRALGARFAFDALCLNDLTMQAATTAQSAGAGFIAGDIRAIDWPERPDLIASASALQWIEAPEILIQRLAKALNKGGWLALSGFGPAQFHELARLGFPPQAPGLRDAQAMRDALATLPDITVLDCAQTQQTLWFDTPRDALRHLRETGVNAAASRTWGKRDLHDFSARYIRRFGQNGRVPLSYHPVWLIAQKRA